MIKNIIKYALYWTAFIWVCTWGIFLYMYLFTSEYLWDRFIFLYKDEQNNNKVLMVQLLKYSNLFPYNHHYIYSAILTGENTKTYSKKYEFSSMNNLFLAKDFIKTIHNTNNENTLHENYALNLELNELKIWIKIDNMTGDFLINNSLNRFTYANLWTTNLSINNKNYKANFILNKVTAHNSLIHNFIENVQSKWIVTFLSDAWNNIYSIDITDVYKTNTNYISHAWLINKNGAILQKEVWEQVKLISNDKKNIIFTFSWWNHSKVILNKMVNLSSKNEIYNFSKWILINDNGSKEVIGFSIMYDDKKDK